MFNYPATEIFHEQGQRRVVWSQQEYDSALSEGWLTERPTFDANAVNAASTTEDEAADLGREPIDDIAPQRLCTICRQPGHKAPKCPNKAAQ